MTQDPRRPTPKQDGPFPWVELGKVLPVVFAGIVFGYDSGYINGCLAMKQFRKAYGKPSDDPMGFDGYMYPTWNKSVVVSSFSVSTFFSALASGFVSDKFGRRNTILIGSSIYTMGGVLQISYPTIGTLAGGRAIAGFGHGLINANVVAYLTEICSPKIRGICICMYQFFVTLGQLVGALVAQCTRNIPSEAAFQIPIGLQLAWGVVLFTTMLTLPESPTWYISKGRKDDASRALSKLRGLEEDHEDLRRELGLMIEQDEKEKADGKGGWKDCFTGGFDHGANLRRSTAAMAAQTLQQLAGVNFIFYYGATFFSKSGLADPFLLTTITYVVNVVATMISFGTIDLSGRRPLLIFGGIAMAVCSFIIAIVGQTGESRASQIVIFAFICLFIFSYACTWGPGAWTVCGEMFPTRIRGHGIALSTASNWFWNSILVSSTPFLVDEKQANLGGKVFFIFGGFGLIAALFAYTQIYETRGLSLPRIEAMFKDDVGKYPRRSSKFPREEAETIAVASGIDLEAGKKEESVLQPAVSEEWREIVKKDTIGSSPPKQRSKWYRRS